MSEIRACRPDDLPSIARIFQKSFRDPHQLPPASLLACLRELFFEHPWYDPALSTRVYVAPDGAVAGFIGVVPVRLSFEGRPVRGAVPTSLAVEEPKRYPLAGAKLLRDFLSGPQQISLSEPANQISQELWARLGGQIVASESMEWLRVLKPAGLALALGGESWKTRLVRPAVRAADRILDRVLAGRLRAEPAPATHDCDLRVEELIPLLGELSSSYALHPQWDGAALRFMLNHAAQNRARGTLYCRVVFGRHDTPLGCYIYHAGPGQIAFVLQILASPRSAGNVLDSLFAHAALQGSVAVKGRTELRLLDPLLRRQCFFFRRHSSLFHSREEELRSAVSAGNAITSGLAAESWMRLCADRFT